MKAHSTGTLENKMLIFQTLVVRSSLFKIADMEVGEIRQATTSTSQSDHSGIFIQK
jgi:hypothetical protein